MKVKFQHIPIVAGLALLVISLPLLPVIHKPGLSGQACAMEGGDSERLFNLSRRQRAVSRRNWGKKNAASKKESRALRRAKAKLKKLKEWRERLQTALERAQARLARLLREGRMPMDNSRLRAHFKEVADARLDIKTMKGKIKTADRRIKEQQAKVNSLTPR